MNRLLQLSLCALVTAGVASCGVLEPNVVPSSTATITPLITSTGNVASADAGTNTVGANKVGMGKVGNRTIQSATLSGGSANGSIQRIFQTDRCNELSRGGFIWFTDVVVLDDWLSPLSPEMIKQVKSKVDFSKQGVLLLDYGTAGTGGAGATVMNERLEVKGKEAIVKVKRFKASSTDKKRAQVVTHPCSLHVIPRTGFSTLVIHSDQGDRLTSFAN